MKEYTAPQVTLIDNWEELKIEPATLEWALDEEKNQIVVTSRYEEVETEDYDDEMRYFKLRPEAVEVLRVDCDAATIEVVKEGVDEEGNKFKTIVTKSQQVAFPIGAYDGEVKEAMDFDYEEFSVHYTDLNEYNVAFHKDGRWWFLELNYDNMGLLGYTYWDDDANDDVEVPFSCETVKELTEYEPYTRGQGNGEFEYGAQGRSLWLICDDGDDQYGIHVEDGRGNVELLNRRFGDENTAWTSIELLNNMFTVRERKDEEGLKSRWICRGFHNGAMATYERDDADHPEFEYDVLGRSVLRIIQNGTLQMFSTRRPFMTEDKETSEVLKDISANVYGYLGIPFVQRSGDYFVVKQEVPVGRRTKEQYRIIYRDLYVGEVYDKAELLNKPEDDYAPLFKVKKDGYWGVINEVGQVVIPFRYSEITAVKDGKDDFDWKNIAYDVTLEEFGRKGWGMLLKDGEIKGESGADFFFINDDDVPEIEKIYKCDTFVQTIPCEYECVSVIRGCFEIEGIQVEKMGRVAVYSTAGRLQENFKLKDNL